MQRKFHTQKCGVHPSGPQSHAGALDGAIENSIKDERYPTIQACSLDGWACL
jgi:hypothetical protein